MKSKIHELILKKINFNVSKKTILAVAFMAVAMVSCQDKTNAKVEDATEAVGTEIETAAENTADAIDSTATKVGEDVKEGAEEGAEKVEEVAKDAKEAIKK